MKRYSGERLRADATVALVANDNIGNYVVSTPLLQMLRAKYPEATIHYYSGSRAEELWSADTRIDKGFNVLGLPPREVARAAIAAGDQTPYDLVINIEQGSWHRAVVAILSGENTLVCGPSLGPDGRKDLPFGSDIQGQLAEDQKWVASDLPDRYPILDSGFIAEIFCRLAYLEGPVPPCAAPQADPGVELPDILMATAASLPKKIWPTSHWIGLVRRINDAGLTVGLLGAKPAAQKAFWLGADAEDEVVAAGGITDLRGHFTLPQVVGALARVKRVITLDNGIMHLAVSAGASTVGLFSAGVSGLWAPPSPHLTIIKARDGQPMDDIKVDDIPINA